MHLAVQEHRGFNDIYVAEMATNQESDKYMKNGFPSKLKYDVNLLIKHIVDICGGAAADATSHVSNTCKQCFSYFPMYNLRFGGIVENVINSGPFLQYRIEKVEQHHVPTLALVAITVLPPLT